MGTGLRYFGLWSLLHSISRIEGDPSFPSCMLPVIVSHFSVQLSEDLASCLTELGDYLKTTIVSELSSSAISLHTFPATDLHLSLSRTVPIPFHTIEPLTQALREKMSRHHT